MRIIIVLLICILFANCNEKSDKLKAFNNLKNTVWIDSLCNEFHFKDSTFIKTRLFVNESIPDEVGQLRLNNKIELQFSNDLDEIEKYHLESQSNEELIFKPLVNYQKEIIVFKKDAIKNTGLEILELQIKIKPTFLSSSGLRELTITNDGKIEYIRADNYKLEKSTFSDATLNQLKRYLEILQLNKYENQYDFAGSDGANYELKIQTNLYSKTIQCTQRPTEGLWNLIAFIDYKIKREKNTAPSEV